MASTNIRSFIPMEKLGQGSFASVYKVKRLSDMKIYALKKIKMNRLPQKAKENSLNQVRFLASFDSPYITKYYEAFFDENIDVLCIVMEYAESGDLRKMINKYAKQKNYFTQSEIWKAMIHLLYGLKILHDNKILHRDIKCENIFISDSKYKIGDMNVSKMNKEGFVDTQTGTPYYASPEVWKDEPYNQKSDIWSLGCILYEMATLRPPFNGGSMEQLYKNVLKGKYQPIPKFYSNQLAQVIDKCLKVSQFERSSTLQLLNNPTLKIYENILLQSVMPKEKMNVPLLQTICFPNNIKELNKCLPKSNYETSASKQMPQEQSDIKSLSKKKESQIREMKIIPKTPQKHIKVQQKENQKCVSDNKILSQNKNSKSKDHILQNLNYQIKSKEIAISNKQIGERKKSSKRIQIRSRNGRRILRQVEKQTIKKSRSRSLPRTERKSMSQSKELASQKSNQKIQAMSIGAQNRQINAQTAKKDDKQHYWNIITQAKKYLQRGLHKNRRLF